MTESDVTAVRSTQELAGGSDAFRRTIATGEHAQLVTMTLQPGEEIGEEVHEHGDQILVAVEGDGEAIIEGSSSPFGAGSIVFVPAGTLHNFRATASGPLRLLTVYGPPEHPAGTLHETKAKADAAEH